jgi:hypothetical protein
MYGSDEDDFIEHDGGPLRPPGWVPGWVTTAWVTTQRVTTEWVRRLPRWLPALGWRPSRGAAVLGIAGLVVGLVAGYALGYKNLRQAGPPGAAAASAAPSAVPGSPASPGPPGAAVVSPAGLGIVGLAGTEVAQATGACSAQHGHELQLGVEVINLSGTTLTLGPVKPILPLGGLRAVSQQWAPCSALASAWVVEGGGSEIPIIKESAGKQVAVDELQADAPPAGEPPGDDVLAPGGAAWFSVTFQVLVGCPRALPVQFSLSYQENTQPGTAQLPGFPDLGQVSYTGCGSG